MKILTNLSLFSVLFFSVAAFASSNNGLFWASVDGQTGQKQEQPSQQNEQANVALTSASMKNNQAQGQLTSNTDKGNVSALLVSNNETQVFSQSQRELYRTDAARSGYQFSNNTDSQQTLANNQIASTASFKQTQHDFSQPSSLL
ncbi:hypothetical protein [Shewanella surugensis]|uniref:Curlin n=1 Tax=Shewanella surugensis TaxID=212020 RepID=A0ABT0LFQ4_9GAMM|nr:hypothetical protein [Shewanella surugensis]MCL1126528.1 hypothetical protein [Shewanella surugensis]